MSPAETLAAIRRMAAARCGLRAYPAGRIAFREWQERHWMLSPADLPAALREAAEAEAAADPPPRCYGTRQRP